MVGYMPTVLERIIECLDVKLRDFYEKNHTKGDYYLTSFSELVKHIVQSELGSKESAGELSKCYSNKKRVLAQKKKRYYESCKQMVESQTWRNDDISHYCFQDIAMNSISLRQEQWDSLYDGKSFEEVEQSKLQLVKQWASDQDTYMIEYPGCEKRTSKWHFTNYSLDLTLNILKTIKELYNFNIDHQTFSFIDDLTDKPVFGAVREKLNTDQDKKVHQIIFGDEAGTRRTMIVFDEDAFEGKNSPCSFDARDQEILSLVIKATQNASSSQESIMLETAEIARAVMKNKTRRLSKSDYDDINRRVRKLAHATIDSYVGDTWVGTCHFLDAVERSNQQGKDYLLVYPSKYLMDELVSNRVTQLPADARNCLDNEAAKLLYHPFMVQRVEVYKKIQDHQQQNGCYEVVYQYGHFLRYVNFGKGNMKNNHAAILAALEDYKSKGILLQDYRYDAYKKTYRLYFKPLSDAELTDITYLFGTDAEIPLDISETIAGRLVLSDYLKD